MPDHVAVGKVGHDQVVALVDAGQNLFGDLRQAQFGNLVERDAFGRWNAHILLAGEGLVVPAVKEKGDMSKFLGFGDPQLAQPGPADDFAQGVLDL